MSLRSRLIIILSLLVFIGASAGLYQLFMLRFESGDIFPPSSSLRSDPLGTGALYQALEMTEGMKAARNYRPLDRFDGEGRTLFYLGAPQPLLTPAHLSNASELEKIAKQGNRVVVAFQYAAPSSMPSTPVKEKDPKIRWGRWDVLPEQIKEEKKVTGKPGRAGLAVSGAPLPATLTVYSNLAFRTNHPDWKTIYAVDDAPVIVERQIGKGSMVLVSDSYFFSNEAMVSGRQTSFITWLAGQNSEIVFDESHLGVREQGGIMVLARRFGLLPLIGAVLLLGLIYIWKLSIPLVPLVPQPSAGETVSHDNFSGLVALMHRSIPQEELLKNCCAQWKKSFARELAKDKEFASELQNIINRSKDPVATYKSIARLRAERKSR